MPPLHVLTSRSSNRCKFCWKNTGTQTHHVRTNLLESFVLLPNSLKDSVKLQAARGHRPAQRPHSTATTLLQASKEAGRHLHPRMRRLVSVIGGRLTHFMMAPTLFNLTLHGAVTCRLQACGQNKEEG